MCPGAALPNRQAVKDGKSGLSPLTSWNIADAWWGHSKISVKVVRLMTAAEAVLRAADEWGAAQEALVAAIQAFRATADEEEAADLAGAKLVLAVARWRSKHDSD